NVINFDIALFIHHIDLPLVGPRIMRRQIIQILLNLRNLLREKFHQYNEQLPFFIMMILALIIVVGGINLFVDLTNTLHTDALAEYDRKVTDFVISFRTPGLNKFFQFITEVGDLNGYLVITALCAVLFYMVFRNCR